MMIFIVFVLTTLQFAAVFYYTIRVIDPENDKNSFVIALIIGFIYSLAGSVGGFFFGLLPLVALVMILTNYYDFELREAIVVIVVLIVANLIFSWILESILF